MHKYQIVFSQQANQDLEDIAEYLSQFYSRTVDNFKNALVNKLNTISENPLSCPVSMYSNKYRRAIINDYIMYYSINTEDYVVIIYIIIHSSRDIEKYLSKLI